MKKSYSVYLAGPEVFMEEAASILAQKEAICRQLGLTPLSPVDNEVSPHITDPRSIALAIYHGNVNQMDQADAIIANITPFRGPHMDSGTAFEIGYFAALKKPIVCYTQASHDLLDRVLNWSEQSSEGPDGSRRDKNGHLIENFGLEENLMITSAVSTGGVVSGPHLGNVFVCCDGFKEAAQSLAHYFQNNI